MTVRAMLRQPTGYLRIPSARRRALVVLALQAAAVLPLTVAPLWELGGR